MYQRMVNKSDILVPLLWLVVHPEVVKVILYSGLGEKLKWTVPYFVIKMYKSPPSIVLLPFSIHFRVNCSQVLSQTKSTCSFVSSKTKVIDCALQCHWLATSISVNILWLRVRKGPFAELCNWFAFFLWFLVLLECVISHNWRLSKQVWLTITNYWVLAWDDQTHN